MQYQPPNKNNPSNPLMKAAALSLEKEYRSLGPSVKAWASVRTNLSFKKSNDFRGVARSKAGDEITVSFALAVKRANLVMRFSFEEGGSESLSINQVAYSNSIEPQAYNYSNVAVTFTNDVVHWELNSGPKVPALDQTQVPSYLEGAVFYSIKENQAVDACVVCWDRRNDRTLVVSGSVLTSLQDLHVEEVQFLTREGDLVKWDDIDQSSLSGNQMFNIPYAKNKERKARLVKQIIRKHLVSQGMMTDGASVQICAAHT